MFRKQVDSQFSTARTKLVSRMKWLLVLLLFCLAYPSAGQVSPYSYTRIDTIRAIQRLFDQKRAAGQIITAVGVPVTIAGTVVGLFGSTLVALVNLGQTKHSIVPVTLLGSSFGLVPTGIGVGRLIRYSRQREDRLIDAYESGETLPTFVRRKLKPRHFSFSSNAPANP